MKNAGIPNFGKARIFVCKAKMLLHLYHVGICPLEAYIAHEATIGW